MPAGRLIDRLPTSTIAWGRCYSVACAELDNADEALGGLLDPADFDALIELESLGSDRVEATRSLLRNDPSGRPSGPFSAIVLDALSIAVQRQEFADQPFGGWVCHLDETTALQAARTRWSRFLASSSAVGLALNLQLYSARIGGSFVRHEDLIRHLANTRSANDPAALADEFSHLRGAGIDGILLCGVAPNASSAIVLRGVAVSHVRPAGVFRLQWEGHDVSLLPPADPGSGTASGLCCEIQGANSARPG